MAYVIHEYDLDRINKAVLGAYDVSSREYELKEKLSKTLREVVVLQNELNDLKNKTVAPLTHEMIDSLWQCFPWLRICISANDNLQVSCERQPLFFHGRRSVDIQADTAVKNDEVFYVSGHRFDFRADLLANGTISLKQLAAEVLSVGGFTSVRTSGVGHPHAVIDRGGNFSSVCQGNNRFMPMYSTACIGGITADTLLIVLRKMCIWFMFVNLDDMYGTLPCGSIDLTDHPQEDIQWLNSRECFSVAADLLKLLQTDNDLCDVFANVRDACSERLDEAGSPCLEDTLNCVLGICDSYSKSVSLRIDFLYYVFLYKFLWALCLHGWFGSYDTAGCVTRDCLIHTVRNDILITLSSEGLDDALRAKSDKEISYILASPLTLTAYAPHWEVKSDAARILRQSFSLDIDWLVCRLREWDSVKKYEASMFV